MTSHDTRVDANRARDALQRDGYVVVPGFFTAEEMDSVRVELEPFRSQGRAPALVDVPGICRLVFSAKLLGLVRSLLQRDPIFLPEYQLHADDFWSSFGFHKDNVDRLDARGPDWSADPFPMIRLGAYLGDYAGHSGSLAIQPGSHRGARYGDKARNVKTTSGDLAVWYFTTTHSANSPSLRRHPDVAPRVPWNSQRAARAVNAVTSVARRSDRLFLPDLDRRQVLFLPFAAESEALARYASYLLHRRYFRQQLDDDPLHGEPPDGCGKVAWLNPGRFAADIDPAEVVEGFSQSHASMTSGRFRSEILDYLRTLRA